MQIAQEKLQSKEEQEGKRKEKKQAMLKTKKTKINRNFN